MAETIETLGDALPKEIARCEELLEAYATIGPAGNFARAHIKADLAEAHRAMIEGDLPGMIEVYQRLKDKR